MIKDNQSLPPVRLPDVAETGMLTFYCHVLESQKANPILMDTKAVEIASRLNPLFANSSSRLLRNLAKGNINETLVTHIVLRAKKYDEYVLAFLKENPDGIIVNIGCGMDLRFPRIDNQRATFFDLDLPEMIEFKKQFYEETDRYRLIAASVFDRGWMDRIARERDRSILFVAEGVLMYLDRDKVKSLILELQSRFPGSDLVCEVVADIFTHKPWNWLVAIKMNQQMGAGKGAVFTFGLKDSHEMETWNTGIKYLEEWSYFDSGHPRLGWMQQIGKNKLMKSVQYTVHYKLEGDAQRK